MVSYSVSVSAVGCGDGGFLFVFYASNGKTAWPSAVCLSRVSLTLSVSV